MVFRYPNVISELDSIFSFADDCSEVSRENVPINLENSCITFTLREMSEGATALGDICVQSSSNEALLCYKDTVIDVLTNGIFDRFSSTHPFPLSWLRNEPLTVHSSGTIQSIQAVAYKFNDDHIRMNSWKFPLNLPLGFSSPMILYDHDAGMTLSYTCLRNDKRLENHDM